MGRKRSNRTALLIKEQVRRRMKERNAVTKSMKYCPKCKQDSVNTWFKKHKGKVETGWVDDPRGGGRAVEVKVAIVRCRICKSQLTCGVYSWESLIDVYHAWFDPYEEELMWGNWSVLLFDTVLSVDRKHMRYEALPVEETMSDAVMMLYGKEKGTMMRAKRYDWNHGF